MTVTTFGRRRSLIGLFAPVMIAGLAILALSSLSGVASAAQHGPALWPAYYDGVEVTILMGPADNSASPTGPDVSKARQTLPLMYALFIPTWTQMVDHDMVLTEVPGSPDYNAKISVVACFPSTNFARGPGRYTSESEVLDGVNADELTCVGTPFVVFAQVVGNK